MTVSQKDDDFSLYDWLVSEGHLPTVCPGCGNKGTLNPACVDEPFPDHPGCRKCGEPWDPKKWLVQ